LACREALIRADSVSGVQVKGLNHSLKKVFKYTAKDHRNPGTSSVALQEPNELKSAIIGVLMFCGHGWEVVLQPGSDLRCY
jgi:hypothetical protein